MPKPILLLKMLNLLDLVNETAKVIAEGKPANNEEALALKTAAGDTLEAAYVNATATIGEKISFRRFALVEKLINKFSVPTSIMVVVRLALSRSLKVKIRMKPLPNNLPCMLLQ